MLTCKVLYHNIHDMVFHSCILCIIILWRATFNFSYDPLESFKQLSERFFGSCRGRECILGYHCATFWSIDKFSPLSSLLHTTTSIRLSRLWKINQSTLNLYMYVHSVRLDNFIRYFFDIRDCNVRGFITLLFSHICVHIFVCLSRLANFIASTLPLNNYFNIIQSNRQLR